MFLFLDCIVNKRSSTFLYADSSAIVKRFLGFFLQNSCENLVILQSFGECRVFSHSMLFICTISKDV